MTIPAERGQRHRWLVSEDSAGLRPVHSGTADTNAAAWSAALRVGLDALLKGTIEDLAIAVDDELPTLLYSPGRDGQGQLHRRSIERDLLAWATNCARTR